MFKTMKQLFTSTNKDLRIRIYFTLGALLIFILGTSITVPGAKEITKELGILDLINAMGGGALKKYSIFALGVTPYITASIIIQLLQMDIIPYFTELSKQGPTGRQKINQITRYVGIFFAFIEGYALAFTLIGKGGNPLDYMYLATLFTAGTAFLLWLGDQITQKGIGNGMSLIIMAGIVSTYPEMFEDAFNHFITLNAPAQAIAFGVVKFLIFAIIFYAIAVGMIFVQESERRIPIQYANKSTNAFGSAAQSFMPIKINTAGVIPVIFASSLLSIPSIIAQVFPNGTFSKIAQQYLDYSTPVGFILYVIFIFLFSYFYTFIQVKPEEFAKNLQENGGYIPGIRPGDETKKYISKVLSRLTVFGATFLVIIAGLPILFSKVTSVPTSVSVVGTGLLIVVGVALETYKQLEGSLLSRSYKRGYRR